MSEHGELITEGQWQNSRWCEVHKSHHGHLYQCEHFPKEILDEIIAESNQFAKSLRDETWIKEQIENGTPPEVIMFFRFFAGIDPKDYKD